MCCESREGGHHSLMGRSQLFSCCCMPYGHHHLTLEKENEMLESYKRHLEEEVSRVDERMKKIKK
jgi:hypothetical protein